MAWSSATGSADCGGCICAGSSCTTCVVDGIPRGCCVPLVIGGLVGLGGDWVAAIDSTPLLRGCELSSFRALNDIVEVLLG